MLDCGLVWTLWQACVGFKKPNDELWIALGSFVATYGVDSGMLRDSSVAVCALRLLL